MRGKTSKLRRVLVGPAALAAVLSTMACGDLFDVSNPGQILDDDLEDADMVETLVTGMSSDFSVAVASVAEAGAAMSDEMEGSSNFVWVDEYRRGIASPEFDLVRWGSVQRARWVAESGIERINRLLGPEAQGNPDATRALLFAGFSNRILGENFCEVAYDGGAIEPRENAFLRAVEHFTSAISSAQASGNQDHLMAAYGGRAQAHLGAGNWSAAVTDAAEVPTDFEFEAVFSANTGRENNDIWSAGGWEDADLSAVATLPVSLDPQDPRAPWTECVEGAGCARLIGGDGVTPLVRQDKYTDRGSNIPVVKGAEMRLIEAEALLREDQVDDAMTQINLARAHWSLPGRTAADAEEAWVILDEERLLTLWLEGRRLHDLDRWDHPFLQGGTLVHEGVPQRDSCWGIGLNECQTNPNIPCS